jgi:ceramide glucosyltransferase
LIAGALPALGAAVYQGLALAAAARWRTWAKSRPADEADPPPLSVLKPVHGRDPRFYEAICSHALQDYPEFEILFGVSDPCDPALEDIRRLQSEFPELPIGIVVVRTDAPNAKAGILAELARRARHPLLLINDSDIVVPPGYFRAATAPLANRETGLVTCLYRAEGESWASRMEALGVATEFAPSVLVARLLGQGEFALGSTMALRAEVLREIGGFEAIAEYLADDYQLGRHVTGRGYRIEFAPVVVATRLGAENWAHTWRHQVRWSRTIRISRPSGYFGYGITHATLWSLAAFAAGEWRAGALALAMRLAAAIAVGSGVLRDKRALPSVWLIPLRDLFGFAVWLGGGFGNTVVWRDRKLRLLRDGRIEGSPSPRNKANSARA